MAQISLLDTAAACGLYPELSILYDLMVYGEHATTSLWKVLGLMRAQSQPDSDSARLVALECSATVNSTSLSEAGFDHQFTLKLSLTSLAGEMVYMDWVRIFVTDSGGYAHWMETGYQSDGILKDFTAQLAPGGVQSASKDFNWGGGPFDFVVSVRAQTKERVRQHIIRRIPILRSGFAAPPNFAVTSPVYIGLWTRPVEVPVIFRGQSPTKWITVAGQIVSLCRTNVLLRVVFWQMRLVEAGKEIYNLQPPNRFYRVLPDGTQPVIPPSSNGSVTLVDALSYFVYGFDVNALPADLSKVVLRIELRYTQAENDQISNGVAVYFAPLTHVTPTVLSPPVRTPAFGNWHYGNAPDHWTNDGHAWPEERYCYDLTVRDENGKTFSGSCEDTTPHHHSGDCTDNTKFFDYGLPVFAVKDGTVKLEKRDAVENFGFDANDKTGDGNFVVAQNKQDGSVAGYFHLRASDKAIGSGNPITTGAQIAEVGNSGSSTEPHLHFGYVVMHPTGRGVNAPVAFSPLKTAAGGILVTGIPGDGDYQS